jgi:hypothetical protein
MKVSKRETRGDWEEKSVDEHQSSGNSHSRVRVCAHARGEWNGPVQCSALHCTAKREKVLLSGDVLATNKGRFCFFTANGGPNECAELDALPDGVRTDGDATGGVTITM